MNHMDEEKALREQELDKAALDGVTGSGEDWENMPKGIYRCAVCGWEYPYETLPISNMFPCKKCGGRMVWHQTSGPIR